MNNTISVATVVARLFFAVVAFSCGASAAFAQVGSQIPVQGGAQVPNQGMGQTMESAEPMRNPGSAAAMDNNANATRPLPVIASPKMDGRKKTPNALQGLQRSAKEDTVVDSFGAYVDAVIGSHLDVYGKSLFADAETSFAPFDASQVNGDYLIGTGDELVIRGWGMVSIDVTASVDRSGAVFIPKVGAVQVAGIKYRDLQAHMKQSIGKFFTNFDISVSIAQTRALQVYVVGHAVRPGTYMLSSMSTLLNALFTSGGPSASGTMRNIQVKRGNVTVATFDLYDMLTKGDKSSDISLRDGDVIYIPEVGPLVALSGNVKTPAIFEMKGATSLADLLGYAGGVDSSSLEKQVIIEKTVDNSYQSIATFTAVAGADRGLTGIPVAPTDVIRVFTPGAVGVQAQNLHEYVRVSGEMKQSGVIELRKGETLRELMFRLGGPTENGYLYATQLKRESVRRTQQQKLDEVADRFERDFERGAGARLASTTDKDAVAIQAAEVERQRRLAQKLRTVKAEGRIVLELANGDVELKNLPDLPLQNGDTIEVPRKPGTVEVLGAVFQNNSFIFKPKRTVKDYVLLAGGATPTADTSEVYLVRADGTAISSRGSWFSGVNGAMVNAGDTIVMPETIERNSFRQSLKEWTTIFYQFGLGAAGLKVLQN